MNRSLLLIVCDFLLLSLLALADFEKSGEPIAAERTAPAAEYDPVAENQEESAIAGLLSAALSAEQSAQEQLERELREARERISSTENTLTELEANLKEREENLRQTEAEAERAAEEARKLAAEKSEIEATAEKISREKERLAGEKESLESKTAELTDRVERLSGRAEASREELNRKAEELARAEAELEERERQLRVAEERQLEAEKRRREAEAARQQLAGEVKTVQREKALLSSNLESAQRTIEAERQEKAELRKQTESLSENVTRLADASSEITEEVRSLRPLTANEIYRQVDGNRVKFIFEGTRTGLFSDAPFTEEIPAVVTSVGDRAFLWLHVEQTPFADPDRRRFLKTLDLFIEANDVRFRVPRMGALDADRSLLFLPLTPAIVERLGVETFPAPVDPFRFEDLIVIDLPESRFGESGFRIQPDQSGFLEIDNKAFSALFGEFSPSRGDVAFTRTGAFLGIVVRPGEAWQAAPVRTGLQLSFGEEFTRSQLDGLP